MEKLKVTVIGLGHQSVFDHIPAVLECDHLMLDSVCDLHGEVVLQIAQKYNIEGYTSIDELLVERRPDIAIVCVPHNSYPGIIAKLIQAKVNILKEKPFALTIEEAQQYHRMIKKQDVKMLVGVQRRFHPIFQSFNQLKSKIGRIFSIEAKYAVNVQRLDEGWRASLETSGGGALMDMGYHYVDLLLWFFGMPDSITGKLSLGNREEQDYDVEDTANVSFEYFDPETNHKTIGNLFVSRLFPRKTESIIVLGSKGSIELTRGSIRRLDVAGNEIECLERKEKWVSAYMEQLESLVDGIRNNTHSFPNSYLYHYKHLAFIEAVYSSDRQNRTVNPKEIYRQLIPSDFVQNSWKS
ncbi:MAG: Gfo/Idh/MocA family oxidoreductase [Spirosomataceae bacterium]